MCVKLKLGLSSSDFVQNYQRSARNLMVLARMPEDCSKTIENRFNTFNNFQSHVHLFSFHALFGACELPCLYLVYRFFQGLDPGQA
eukprot:11130859-Heterocapsa_arctica.AAC.1